MTPCVTLPRAQLEAVERDLRIVITLLEDYGGKVARLDGVPKLTAAATLIARALAARPRRKDRAS